MWCSALKKNTLLLSHEIYQFQHRDTAGPDHIQPIQLILEQKPEAGRNSICILDAQT